MMPIPGYPVYKLTRRDMLWAKVLNLWYWLARRHVRIKYYKGIPMVKTKKGG